MRKRYIIFLASLFLFIVFSLFYFYERTRILTSSATAWDKVHRADCAIVLTGGPGRVREGFSLLAQKRVKKLIVSGVYPKAQLRDIFPEWPFYGDIKKSDVVLEKRSNTSYGNAQQSLPLVEALSCGSVVLITSKTHMYRAGRIFASVFPENIRIHHRAIVYGSLSPDFWEISVEVVKSLFYSTWAYDQS